VDRDLLAELELLGDLLHGSLDGGLAHRGLGRRVALVMATVGGKEEVGMPMSRPVLSQPLERFGGQRYVSVLGPFASMDVNELTSGVSHQKVREVEELLNNRPRACLGFRTPNEVFSGNSERLLCD
jgi:hypothetical protein